MDNFQFFSLFKLAERYMEVKNEVLAQYSADSTKSIAEIFESTEVKLKEFQDELSSQNSANEKKWTNVAGWIDANLSDLTQAHSQSTDEIEDASKITELQGEVKAFFGKFRQQIQKEIEDELFVSLPELPHDTTREKLENAHSFFPYTIFQELSAEAQYDFQQSSLCLLYGLYSAAIILAWRGAEASLQKYYQVVTGKEVSDGTTWGGIEKELENHEPAIEKTLLSWVRSGRSLRNKYAHPNPTGINSEIAFEEMKSAIGLTNRLTRDLLNRNQKVSVAVCLSSEVSFTDYVDVALAHFILHNTKGVKEVSRLSINEDYGKEYDYILGLGSGTYSFKGIEENPKECVSKAIANHFDVFNQYMTLINFVLRYCNQPSADPPPKKSLEDLLRAIEIDTESEDDLWNRLYALFDEILKKELSPDQSFIVQDLSESSLSWYEAEKAMGQQNEAWNLKQEIKYAECVVAIISSHIDHFNYLKSLAFNHKYQVVALVDNDGGKLLIEIRPRVETEIELRPLWKYLKENYDIEVTFKVNQLSVSEGWGWSPDELKRGFEESDPSRSEHQLSQQIVDSATVNIEQDT